jgi:hypothetical protein
LSDQVIDELLAGARSEEEIVGPGGLLAQLTKRSSFASFWRVVGGHLASPLCSRPWRRRARIATGRLSLLDGSGAPAGACASGGDLRNARF